VRRIPTHKMSTLDFSAWINDGEKYAFVGLEVRVEGPLPNGQLTQNFWVLSDARFSIPAHWREWLGTIRVEQLEDCNLFLMSKLKSSAPKILDAENQTLQRRVGNFYAGLVLAGSFAPSHAPVMLTGARHGEEIDIRQQQEFETPVVSLARPYPPIQRENVLLASQLGTNIEILPAAGVSGGQWRLFRTLHIYMQARTSQAMLDRLHQYCRCVEGLILPQVGRTRSQFKSRTELFIGPGHHTLMGELYDIRSAVEHLHENRYLETFDRAARLDLVKKETIVEYIARTALVRIIGNANCWPHFSNTSSLSRFWSLPADERRLIWGDPIDPMAALHDYDEQFINDGQLGAP
jgi:hypothetical protein